MLGKIAAVLAAITACVHLFVGGADALAPMLAAELPTPVEGAMHACWHMVTFLLAWSVVVFLGGGKPAFHFGILWIASSIVFIGVSITQAGLPGLIVNPQWTILGVTGILGTFSSRLKTDEVGT